MPRLLWASSMTAQINDTCFHRQISFVVSGISGAGLFDPEAHGIKPVALSSACWRGYVAHYSVIEGELFLTRFNLGLSDADTALALEGKGPELFGVRPRRERVRHSSCGFLYDDFQWPIPFTGGLLLADRFIQELYVHMGFHPAWKFRQVREVIFNQGRVMEDHDRSQDMKSLRDELAAREKAAEQGAPKPSRKDMMAWIERCFSRKY